MSEPIQSIAQNNYILATQQEVSHDNSLSGKGTVDSPLGLNETVLWSGSIGTNSTATLSEPYTNFERIRVAGLCGATVAANEGYSVDISSQPLHELTLGSMTMNSTAETDGLYNIIEFMPCLFNGTTVTTKNGRFLGYWGAKWQYQTNTNFALKRVIGINRIANN